MTAQITTTTDLVKRFEEWIDELPIVSISRRQVFKELLDEVRLGCLPPSKHQLIYSGDLEVFGSMFPATAKRIRNELNRMQTLLERKDG